MKGGDFEKLTEKGIKDIGRGFKQLVAVDKNGGLHVGHFDAAGRFIVSENGCGGLALRKDFIAEIWLYELGSDGIPGGWVG